MTNHHYFNAVFLTLGLLSSGLCTAGVVSPSNSTIDFPHDQSYINTNQPTIIGSMRDAEGAGVSDTTVDIFLDGTKIGSAVSDENGTYRLFVENALADGAYQLSVFCGGVEIASESHQFFVDTTFPTTTILNPQEDEVLTNGAVTISGTTEENAMVIVFLDEDTFGSTCYADASGQWSIEYENVGNGNHSVVAQATDIAGNQGELSEVRTFLVTL
jgi:hypothetical protein